MSIDVESLVRIMGSDTFLYITVSVVGVFVGSFLNVCILRIPDKDSILTRSRCVYCRRKLKWFELIPILSFLALRGKCRSCKKAISVQYPLIEGLNGILWAVVFHVFGASLLTVLGCLLASALLVVAVIDGRTYEIPAALNIFILALGCARVVLDLPNWYVYAIGAVSVSGPLLALWYATGGRGMGGGDIKLMAVCGLFLGWKLTIIAFFAACIIGSLVHLTRMALKQAGRTLAFGPYIATGAFAAMLRGEQLLEWYLGSFFG